MIESMVNITLKISVTTEILTKKNPQDMTIKEWKKEMAKHISKAIQDLSEEEVINSIRNYEFI